MVFLWIKQQRDNIQQPVKHKPVYSKPFNPESLIDLYKAKEGFVITETAYTGGLPVGVSGSTNGGAVMASLSGSGGSGGSIWPSQFDLSPTQQALYGTWETTAFDSYYDDYEQAESEAATTQSLRFNDITPALSPPPDFGSSLGAFDSDTTRIPWDKDNESYQQKEVVWGFVSEQASRSIYLKTYVNQLAAAAESFIPCSEENATNYCYKSPLFSVSVNDPALAYATKTGEAVVQAVGTLPMMYLSEIDMDMSNFSEIRKKRLEAIGGFFDSFKSKTSHPLGAVKTIKTPVGNSLGLGVGARKVTGKMKAMANKLAAAYRATLKTTQEVANTSRTAIVATFNGAAAAGGVATVATAGAAAPAAAVLSAIAVGVDLFFGAFAGVMMGIEAIINPMMEALLHTGGECPDNYKAITELVPTPVLMALSALLPLAPFLQSFDPYVCWGLDSHGIGNVRLKIPPKVPSFMSDRTLSLVYHAAWQTGNNPAIPSPTNLSFILDPLPPGYVWLEQSDLANTPNVNELTKLANEAAKIAQGSKINAVSTQTTGSGKLPSNIAVKKCEENTTPSADGKRCIKRQMQTATQMPTLSSCARGSSSGSGVDTVDDGYNCWNAIVDPSCTGGKISYETTNTWNDTTGYFRVTTTPLICNGVTQTTNTNIAKAYKERIQCTDPAFPERLEQETLCFAKCPTGFVRQAARCVGTTESYDRQYMFGTSTMYREQSFNPNLLKDLPDVTIPYCDFSKPYVLDKMAQFYYKNSLKNPVVNEDGTIQIQLITKFFGVIASSELSCDVVCSIDFVTYDPITGGNYSSYTGCSYPDDEMFKACAFCYRRFYFIRTGAEEHKDEFTVTGCTWADYTAPEAMVRSSDVGTNLVASLPKKFDVHRQEASIVDYARFKAAWDSGQIMAEAGAGLMDAAISVGAGMLGGPGGGAVAKGIVGNGVKSSTKKIVKEVVKESGEKFTAKQAAEVSANISKALAKDLQREGPEEALKIARAAGMGQKDAAKFVAEATKNVKGSILAEQRGGLVGGLVTGIGAGLFTSMYLDPLLADTLAGALPPADVDGAANTFITGKDMYNLQVVTKNNWWTANQGPIYELAPGVIPTINFCEGIKILPSHCSHKYVVRDMVNKYHNEYERSHIKQIVAIEPRGTDGCYYKWNEVQYDPVTNTEQTVLLEKEIILSHRIADYATCTFKPTTFTTNINDPAYPVRSYTDPTTASLPNPRIIYPTRNTVYTSDLFARYVRVRPPFQSADTSPNTYMPLHAYMFGSSISSNPAAWPVAVIKNIGGLMIYIAEESSYLKMVADDADGTAKFYDISTVSPWVNASTSWNDTYWTSGTSVGTRASGQYMLYLEGRSIKSSVNPTANPALIRNANGRIISMYGDNVYPVNKRWPVAAMKNVGGTNIYMYETFRRPQEAILGSIIMVADDAAGTAKYIVKNGNIRISTWSDTYWTTATGNGTRTDAHYMIDKNDSIVNTNFGISTYGDGLLNLAQISVFDVSGLNISTQLETFATSVSAQAAGADIVVNGTSAQTDSLSSVWQPATSADTEYWEVDLGKLVNISEIVYFGGTFDAARYRNKGVRIEFLYTKGATDAPILSYTLPTDEAIQLIPLYSSSYMVPMFPLTGTIKVPRPIAPGKVLGIEFGCMNRCEDKGVIDSLTKQYNNMSSNASIVKILRAITPNSTGCEYEAEVVMTDIAGGSSFNPKNTVSKQILSMQIAPSASKGFGNVMGRYIKISPSYTPGTVLEFSKIIVRNTVRGGSSSDYTTNQHYIVSTGKNINSFNTFFELKEIYGGTTGKSGSPSTASVASQTFNMSSMRFLMDPPPNYTNDYTKIEPDSFPNVWRAADNQEGTFFELDLVPPGAGSSANGNYEIYDIVIVGCTDRTKGGLRGVKIELFPDRPEDQENAIKAGVATPTFTYYLPTDELHQRILVEPPSKCEFLLTKTDVLKSPTFLQENSAPLTAVDTSGGVFSFSNILDSVKSAWDALAPTSPTAMVAPIQDNLKKSDQLVHQMLDTISQNKTLLSSTKKCSDPDILKLMMTAYNIQKGAPITGEFNVTKHAMLRIVKAGQSTPSTCDILFENLEENYDDYIEDITDKASTIKSLKTARFKFIEGTSPAQVVPDMTSVTYDISSNALGILSDRSALSPVYAGPSCSVDCGNPVQIKVIASKLEAKVTSTSTQTKRTVFTSAKQTFQTSPLSCEYMMSKITSSVSKITGNTLNTSPVDTYVKAVFTLDKDGCTPLLSTVKEYDPDPTILTFSKDYSKSYLDGEEVTLPSLYGYEPEKKASKRVDSTVKNIS